MTSNDPDRRHARDVKPRRTVAARPRNPQEIVEGVRRQRQHILLMDGEDPLRGGVAD